MSLLWAGFLLLLTLGAHVFGMSHFDVAKRTEKQTESLHETVKCFFV